MQAFSPDEVFPFEGGPPATILFTWIVMVILVVGSWLITRKLSSEKKISRWQTLLEVVIQFLRTEIRGISNQDPDTYLPFIGTIFVFIAACSLFTVIPGFMAPTAALSTTVALAISVGIAVPIYGVANLGVARYLRNYLKPSPFMLPFNIIGEVSRTLALAVRLFGNMMSGDKVVGILLGIVPLVFPLVMLVVGSMVGLIQAYIFAVLAMVYISSGMQVEQKQQRKLAEAEVRKEMSHSEPAAETESENKEEAEQEHS